MKCDAKNVEDVVDFRRERDRRARKELVENDLDWIEPKRSIRFRATSNPPIGMSAHPSLQPLCAPSPTGHRYIPRRNSISLLDKNHAIPGFWRQSFGVTTHSVPTGARYC